MLKLCKDKRAKGRDNWTIINFWNISSPSRFVCPSKLSRSSMRIAGYSVKYRGENGEPTTDALKGIVGW